MEPGGGTRWKLTPRNIDDYRSSKRLILAVKNTYTDKQGQYLAFIYTYSHMFRRPPAEADMQHHFQVSPPSVHQMIVTLDCGLISSPIGSVKPSLPFLSPLIYPLTGSACFRDIQAGTNGEFSAGPGYDMVTGIGVPNVLIRALTQQASV